MAKSNVVTTLMVTAIREERANGGWTVREIAARHGISPITVSRISTGVTHPHLPGPITPKATITRHRTCWRGHPLNATNRRQGPRWQDCKSCHTIRNREWRQRKAAQA